MNKQQLEDEIVIPTLKQIPKGYSYSAVTAIMMIIAHESRQGHYIRQGRFGPALGLIQMEPATHNDVWRHGDTIWSNAVKLGIITKMDRIMRRHPAPARLIYDLRYCVFMARQKLFMVPKAFPVDREGLSKYLKKHWNTAAGKADEMSYLDDYLRWI